jgi:hypothetical protein
MRRTPRIPPCVRAGSGPCPRRKQARHLKRHRSPHRVPDEHDPSRDATSTTAATWAPNALTTGEYRIGPDTEKCNS